MAANVQLNIGGIDYLFDANGIGVPLMAPIPAVAGGVQ